MNDPLQLPLRDIHLPGEIGWWPPAPGWWILAMLIIVGVSAFFLWRRRRERLRRSAINMARRELSALEADYGQHRDARRFIADLSILLRRLSISAFPRTESASLTGQEWLSFLDRPLEDTPFSSGPGRILVDAPYRPEVNDEELQPLLELCHRWIGRLADEKRERSV